MDQGCADSAAAGHAPAGPMRWRRVACTGVGAAWPAACAAGLALLTSCAAPPQDFPESAQPVPEDTEPTAPADLEQLLETADREAASTQGDCLQRLDIAQGALDGAVANSDFGIVLPRGPARADAIAYRIHLARSACVGDGTQRTDELRAALAAARYSVAEYRDALDYKTMAIMQFNVAAILRTLDDKAGGVSALQSAIAMDDEYGFDTDAQENRAVLTQWLGAPAPPAADGARSGAAQRQITLRFAWQSTDADVHLQTSFLSVSGGQVTHASAARTVQRRVRRYGGGWQVAYGPGDLVQEDVSELARDDVLPYAALPLVQGLLELPDLQLDAQGGYQQVLHANTFADELQRAAQGLIRAHSGSQEPTSEDIRAASMMFAPAAVSAQAAEDYRMTIGAWAGATLQQGVWYTTQVPLTIPPLPWLSLVHEVEFSYTHRVPCQEGAPQPACVEIVAQAIPRPGAFEQTMNEAYGRTLQGAVGYRSATYMRIVLDPNTMTPYVRDTRRYWHLTCPPPCRNDAAMERTLWRASTLRPAPLASAEAP